jgi:Flp pilus assembly protein TadD
LAVVIAGCACLVAGAMALATDVKLRASREAAAKGDLARAADDARAAASIEPWAAAPRQQLALVEEERDDPAAAERALREAIERAPQDWRLWFTLTRVRANAGDREGARRALRRTRALAPPAASLQGVLGLNSRE